MHRHSKVEVHYSTALDPTGKQEPRQGRVEKMGPTLTSQKSRCVVPSGAPPREAAGPIE